MSRASPLRLATPIGRRLALAAGLMALPLAIVGAATLAPDRVLDRAYGPAMARAEKLWPDAAEQATILRPASLPAVRNGLRKPFAVGDRMVIESRAGTPEAIEVIAIEKIDGTSLGLDGVVLQMVTARADGAAAGETVRFLFAIDQPAQASKPPHSL